MGPDVDISVKASLKTWFVRFDQSMMLAYGPRRCKHGCLHVSRDIKIFYDDGRH